MALELLFKVSENLDSLTCQFEDLTGDYNATTNPTGWGAPNPDKGSVTAATLDYLIPTTTYEVGTTGGSINLLLLGYPSSLLQFTLPATDFGYAAAEEFADGPWQFTLTVTTGGTDYSTTWVGMFRNGFLCCLDDQAKANNSNPCDCDCDNISVAEKKIIRTQISLAAVEYAETCQDVTSGTIAMQRLNELCTSGTDCGCS